MFVRTTAMLTRTTAMFMTTMAAYWIDGLVWVTLNAVERDGWC